MDEMIIEAEPRDIDSTRATWLRQAGKVPGVLYGKGGETVHIQCDDRQIRTVFRKLGSKADEYQLRLNGNVEKVVVRELQRHVTRGDLMHIDFLRL